MLTVLLMGVKRTMWDCEQFAAEEGDQDGKHTPRTISVPEAGKKYYGLCREASYDAARRGDIPVIKVGRLLRVPVAAMERKLDSDVGRDQLQPA
jgi:hypothetical protein